MDDKKTTIIALIIIASGWIYGGYWVAKKWSSESSPADKERRAAYAEYSEAYHQNERINQEININEILSYKHNIPIEKIEIITKKLYEHNILEVVFVKEPAIIRQKAEQLRAATPPTIKQLAVETNLTPAQVASILYDHHLLMLKEDLINHIEK